MYDEIIVRNIKNLKEKGKSYKEISEMIGISKASVWWILNKRKKGLHQKPGPKPKINSRLSTRIKRYVEKMNLDGQKVNCNVVKNELHLDVKRRTLNDWFNKKNYICKSHPQKFMLTKKHKEKRIEIITQWFVEKINWDRCIFTDEKCWSLDGPDNW